MKNLPGSPMSLFFLITGLEIFIAGIIILLPLTGAKNVQFQPGSEVVNTEAVINNFTNDESRELAFAKGELSVFPIELTNVAYKLDSLTIEGLGSSFLPPEIGNLNNLQNLDIHKGSLTAIPPQIGSLSNLKTLLLYENEIASMPQEIGSLSQLEVIDLRSNNLTSVPIGLGNLANLKRIHLGGNNIPVGEIENLKSLLPNTLITN